MLVKTVDIGTLVREGFVAEETPANGQNDRFSIIATTMVSMPCRFVIGMLLPSRTSRDQGQPNAKVAAMIGLVAAGGVVAWGGAGLLSAGRPAERVHVPAAGRFTSTVWPGSMQMGFEPSWPHTCVHRLQLTEQRESW